MIKIIFEFKNVREVIAFLQTGDLARTNETVGVLLPSTDEVIKAIENAVEVEDKPLSARERRLARKNENEVRANQGTEGKKSSSSIKSGLRKSRITRKRNAKSRSKKAEPVSDEITDADLAKAASHGAEEIGPKLVTEILEQFGVGNVAELKDDQRKEFIDLIDSEMK